MEREGRPDEETTTEEVSDERETIMGSEFHSNSTTALTM